MSDSFEDAQVPRPNPDQNTESSSKDSENVNDEWDLVEELEPETEPSTNTRPERLIPNQDRNSASQQSQAQQRQFNTTVVMVETAFLASTASLIWLINYYFPLGPVLKMFFPVPIALVYMRRGNRASWMAALVSGLLLSVLQGPTRSILFLIPYGLMGVQLGALWKRQANWLFSIGIGTLLGTLGFFFRFWLLSILLSEDLWVYVMTQITELVEWGFVKLGLLAQPSLMLIQVVAIVAIVINNAIYLFVVHLVALLIFDRLKNPIPRPPQWVQVLLDY
ncbi:hypothetical protein MC7420_6047 [Coleofasciculus chthonoplastes PCC 7420]|uniref:DUF2232 domain-containing protein n=1 Tax=Coleofasciculus chthonoplastes PCC 7420 TaxID=118168 RepID=B4VU40_9CYAN|nr:DUF2232 domain-containing protein [Coleofasciculus chthonoplastes]EDX74569.1 hypothetical protein MC7420_6047 [Coleofasciculus chthonoplastes PCC 7420]